MKIQQLNDYWESSSLSQSFLKGVINNNHRKKRGKHLDNGAIIDCMLFTPEIVSEVYPIGKTLGGTLGEIFEEAYEQTDEFDEKLLLNIALEKDYYKSKEETILKKIKDNLWYWDSLKIGKFISQKDYDTNQEHVENIKRDKNVKWIHNDNAEYQVPIYAVIENISCKGLLDYLDFDLKNKLIVIRDLKCTDLGSLKEWLESAVTFNLPFQASFYRELVKVRYSHLINNGWFITFDWVVYIKRLKKLFIVNCSELDLEIGEYGTLLVESRESLKTNTTFKCYQLTKGWRQAIDIYKECVKLGLNDWDLAYHYNDGIFHLKSIYL